MLGNKIIYVICFEEKIRIILRYLFLNVIYNDK